MVSLTQESTDSGAEQKKRSRPGMVVAEAMKIKEKQLDHTGPHKSRWRRLTRFEVNSATNIVQQKHVQKPRGGQDSTRSNPGPTPSPKWQGSPKFTVLAALRSCGNIDLTAGLSKKKSRQGHIPGTADFAYQKNRT